MTQRLQLFFVMAIAIQVILAEDPCDSSVHTVVSGQSQRSTAVPLSVSVTCDRRTNPGWYRFCSSAGNDMPTSCVPALQCSTYWPIWLNGTLPSTEDGLVEIQACATVWSDCCYDAYQMTVKVKSCGAFRVYYLTQTASCEMAYCFGTKIPDVSAWDGCTETTSTAISVTASQLTIHTDATTAVVDFTTATITPTVSTPSDTTTLTGTTSRVPSSTQEHYTSSTATSSATSTKHNPLSNTSLPSVTINTSTSIKTTGSTSVSVKTSITRTSITYTSTTGDNDVKTDNGDQGQHSDNSIWWILPFSFVSGSLILIGVVTVTLCILRRRRIQASNHGHIRESASQIDNLYSVQYGQENGLNSYQDKYKFNINNGYAHLQTNKKNENSCKEFRESQANDYEEHLPVSYDLLQTQPVENVYEKIPGDCNS